MPEPACIAMVSDLPLSVIVVAHNSGVLLGRCVAAVLAQDGAAELIVVDNASRDGSVDALPLHAALTVVRNADNRGFAAACNQGAARARGELLLFLNPDCEPARDVALRLRALLEALPDVGLLGAQLLETDGREQAASRRNAPTPARVLRRMFGAGGEGVERTAAPGQGEIETVDAVSGALMLIPRALFQTLGGFDEGYRLHCEDLDLCRRVQQTGRQVAIATQVRVLHHKGTSSRRRPVWVEWQKHRGMLRYFRKFDAAGSSPWLRLLVPVGVWLRFPLAAVRACWRAWRA